MNDERDELLKEIGAALSIEPSPAFAARVRAELTTAPAGLPWGRIAGALAAASLAVVLVSRMGLFEPAAPDRASPAAVPAPAVTAAAPLEIAVPPQARPRPASAEGAARQAPRRAQPRAAVISPDEIDAFWQIVAEVQVEGTPLPPQRWPIDDITGEIAGLPEIAAVHVRPVTIEPLPGAGASVDTSGGLNE